MNENYNKAMDLIETRDYKSSLQYLARAVQEGYLKASVEGSKLYKQGLGVSRNYQHAFDILQECIKKGSIEAEIEIADYYLNGLHVKVDEQKGLALLKQHMNQYPEAIIIYGKYLEKNIKSVKDIKNIKKFYEEALELNKDNHDIKRAIKALSLDGIWDEIDRLNYLCEEIEIRIKELFRKEILLWSMNIFIVTTLFFWWPAINTHFKRGEDKEYLKDVKRRIEILEARIILLKNNSQ